MKQRAHTHISSGTRKVFSDFTEQDCEGMSTQSLQHLNIVFETSTSLDLYVIYVNFIGLVLWYTFVWFNFATFDSYFIIVCGMVVGWVCNSFSKECRCHANVAPGQKVLVLFYSFMFSLIVSLGASKCRAPEDLRVPEQLNLYIPAFCSGIFWTAISTEVAFTDIVQGNVEGKISRGILYDARRAVPTFLLVMCVLLEAHCTALLKQEVKCKSTLQVSHACPQYTFFFLHPYSCL
jgi:hypothetical protein